VNRRNSISAAIALATGLLGGAHAADDACTVRELKKSDVQGLRVYAPDGKRYLINKEDEEGTAQIYLGREGNAGLTCLTCEERPNGPKRKRFKMQPHWHPSGQWIFLAVERDKYSPPPILGWSKQYREGQLQNGIWTNMYAVSPDGERWHRLTDFKSNVPGTPDGFTGPAFTPDGKKAVWSQIVDGNVFKYSPFGRWDLILADFEEQNGVPSFINLKNITPAGMNWNEPGNFHPDNQSLLLTGSDQKDAQGMDQYILNIATGKLTNLTNSTDVWDEHGVFSPDGEKILFMSAYPYRSDPKASKVMSIKTEFMLMDRDGANLTQLTHYRTPGYAEYSTKGGIAAVGEWAPDGRSINLARLFFPNYEYWEITFQGACGMRRR
jgi:Tol biopolymer transport system component